MDAYLDTSTQSLFGLQSSVETTRVLVLPVPWDVTCSYRRGTSRGPQLILEASDQIDLYHPDFPDLWQQGIAMLPLSENLLETNSKIRQEVDLYRQGDLSLLGPINHACEAVNDFVYKQAKRVLDSGKLLVSVGGEHSISYGAIKATSEIIDSFGVLQIDAHADLRTAYEGFDYSHASVMTHVVSLPQVSHLIQVGVRDLCEEEARLIDEHPKIINFSDWTLKNDLFTGTPWADVCSKIVESCPERVYITFDIDGLSPSYCPSTGTPVPGGLSFEQVFYLIRLLVQSGRKIVGFDLVEVAGKSHDLNAIIGMRALYHGIGYMCSSLGEL